MEAERAVPAVRHHEFSTGDTEAAHAYLRDVYTDHACRFSGDAGDFAFRSSVTEEDRFGVQLVRHSMSTEATTEPYPALQVVQMLGGWMRMAAGRDEVVARPGEVFVTSSRTRSDVSWTDFSVGVVALDPVAAARVAGAFCDIGPDGLRPGLMRPVSAARERYWKSVVRQVSDGFLREPEIRDSALNRTTMFQTLVLTLLDTFPIARGDGDPGRGHEPLAVRRAVEFIEQHAGSDISLADIAAASGVGARALQQGMRRHRDTTPLRLLREVRLERAHEELRAALPGTTVAAVAARWGFTNPGRFTAAHRRRYGLSPADLLTPQTGGTSVK